MRLNILSRDRELAVASKNVNALDVLKTRVGSWGISVIIGEKKLSRAVFLQEAST